MGLPEIAANGFSGASRPDNGPIPTLASGLKASCCHLTLCSISSPQMIGDSASRKPARGLPPIVLYFYADASGCRGCEVQKQILSLKDERLRHELAALGAGMHRHEAVRRQ